MMMANRATGMGGGGWWAVGGGWWWMGDGGCSTGDSAASFSEMRGYGGQQQAEGWVCVVRGS